MLVNIPYGAGNMRFCDRNIAKELSSAEPTCVSHYLTP
jgi:hypothetical protein